MGTFTVTPAGLDFTPIFIVLGILAVFAFVFALGFALDVEWIGDVAILGVFGTLIVGGVFGAALTFGQIPRWDHIEQQVAGIESLGYDNVDLDGEFFTASDEDGKYVYGVLVDLGENEYTVLETKGATK